MNIGVVVGLVALGYFCVWGMLLAVPINLWDRRKLRSDVHGWLRRRGVDCPEDVSPHVLWVEGGVGLGGADGRGGFYRADSTVVVVTPSVIVFESQWPLAPWRRRLVVRQGTVLRNIGGRIADPKRRCLVASSPPDRLIWVLRTSAWDIRDVPF